MVYDDTRGVTLLFGGVAGDPFKEDTWAWDGSTWAQLPISGPSACGGHAMVYNSASETALLYGGQTLFERSSETWELGTRAGDFDCDGDADLSDLKVLCDCLHGPEVVAPPPGCSSESFRRADLARDGDVDLHDFSLFEQEFTGPLP